jgi:hypothetical protein
MDGERGSRTEGERKGEAETAERASNTRCHANMLCTCWQHAALSRHARAVSSDVQGNAVIGCGRPSGRLRASATE